MRAGAELGANVDADDADGGLMDADAYEDDDNVYHYESRGGAARGEWVPAPPSEASASLVMTAPRKNRRAAADRSNWQRVAAPTLDVSGKPTAHWESNRSGAKGAVAEHVANANYIIAGIDCVAIVKRLRNCWTLQDKEGRETAGLPASDDSLALRLAFVDKAFEDPEPWLETAVREHHRHPHIATPADDTARLEEWARRWAGADETEKQEAAARIRSLVQAIRRALVAEAAFERIERAEDTILEAVRKEGLEHDASGGAQNEADQGTRLVAHAATRLQATWRGFKSRHVIANLEKKELLDLEAGLAHDRDAFRNRDVDQLQRVARQRATARYELLRAHESAEKVPRQHESKALGRVRLAPGLEAARLCAAPDMGCVQQEMDLAFDIFIHKLWAACTSIRAQITEGDSMRNALDVEADLRALPSFGPDGRVARDDLDGYLKSHAPALSAHDRAFFLAALDKDVDGLIPVARFAAHVRGALSDRRHLMASWAFERIYFEPMAKPDADRLASLVEFYTQFAPSQLEDDKARVVHSRYKDNERVNKDLFQKLYAKHAPWLSPPAHLWSRAAQRARAERRCQAPAGRVLAAYRGILTRAQLPERPDPRVLNAVRHAVSSLEAAVARRGPDADREIAGERPADEEAQDGIVLTRADWLAFHAELSAGIDDDRDFESVVCRANDIAEAAWADFAERRARRDLVLRDKWALDRVLEDAELAKMARLRSRLSARNFEDYERDLYEVLRKVRGAFLRVCGTDRTLASLEREFQEAPSFGDDRKLSRRDFRAALTRYGIILTREEMQTLQVHYDTGNSGHVSMDAFFFGIRAASASRAARARVANEHQSVGDIAKRQRRWIKAMRRALVPEREKHWVRYEDDGGRPFWSCRLTGERTWVKPKHFERHDKAKWEAETKRRVEWALQTLKKYYVQANSTLDAQLEIVRTMVNRALPLVAHGLSHLPQSIFASPAMRQITHLTLDANCLADFPRAVLDLRSLRYLSMCKNSLSSLRAADLRARDSCFSNLTSLRLSHNALQQIPKALCELTALRDLALDHNQIATVASGAFAGLELRCLELSSNRIRSLPEKESDWAAMTTSLVVLNLRNNQLSSAPRAVGDCLSALVELDLADNRIDSLPESFGAGLTSLKTLRLEGNNLLRLPSGVGRAGALEVLTLQHNALSELPDTVCSLGHLRELRINNNRLAALPDRIGDLAALESLKLQCNRLTRLPANFASLSALTECWLHQNDIEVLPSGIPPVLAHWKLHNNRLRELPASIGEQGLRLEHIDLAGNLIRQLPRSFYRLRALTSLRLDGNPLEGRLAEVAQSGKFRTHDEENYGILLRKLIDGLRSYDLENRVDTALGVTVAQAMRESAYELQEKLQQAKEVALGVNAKRTAKRAESVNLGETSVDKGARALGRGRSSTQQALARCLRRFSEKEDKSGNEISKKGFQTCIQVVGNLLTPPEVARLTARVFVNFQRPDNPDIICFDAFIDSLEHVNRVGNLREQPDKFAARNYQIARAVIRFCAAQQTRLATTTAKRLIKSPTSAKSSARSSGFKAANAASRETHQDLLHSLHERDKLLDEEIARVQREKDQAQRKAHVVLEYERLEQQRSIYGHSGAGIDPGASRTRPQSAASSPHKSRAREPTRPTSAGHMRRGASLRRSSAAKDETDEMWDKLRNKNRQLQALQREAQQLKAVAHYYDDDKARDVQSVEERRKRKAKKNVDQELSVGERELRAAQKQKRKKLRLIFDRFAEPESLGIGGGGAPGTTPSSVHKRVITKGRMISALGEFFRHFGNGRFDASNSKDWQARLLATVNEAFTSGLRDAKTGQFTAFDQHGKGALEWTEFLRLTGDLERRMLAGTPGEGEQVESKDAKDECVALPRSERDTMDPSLEAANTDSHEDGGFLIYIDLMSSMRTLNINLQSANETVATLKSRLAFSEALLREDIHLVYKRKRLADSLSMRQAGVKPGAHLKLILLGSRS